MAHVCAKTSLPMGAVKDGIGGRRKKIYDKAQNDAAARKGREAAKAAMATMAGASVKA